MSANLTCSQVQEATPLLFVGAIPDEESDQLLEHLRQCDDCREVFKREQSLFGMAASSSQSNPLADHPDLADLELFADEPGKLAVDSAATIEAHLSDCKLCGDLVARFKSLPFNLDDLVSADQLPLVSAIETSGERRTESKPIKLFRLVPAKWTVALASAAAVVLISLATIPWMAGESDLAWEITSNREAVQLVAGLRSDTSELEVIERDGLISVSCYFDAFFDEESYSIELISGDEILLETEITPSDFSPELGITIEVTSESLEAGDYQIKLVVRTIDGSAIVSEAIYPFTLSR
jgi:predicted anti-sigma-YlaC factor YlaD